MQYDFITKTYSIAASSHCLNITKSYWFKRIKQYYAYIMNQVHPQIVE